MVERKYVIESDDPMETNDETRILNESLIIDVLESLKESSLVVIAKKLHIQIPGFRLKSASKTRLVKAIQERLPASPAKVATSIVEAIESEYPELLPAISDENEDFDLDYWLSICGIHILYFVFYCSDNKYHEKLLSRLKEKEESEDTAKQDKPDTQERELSDKVQDLARVQELQAEIEKLRNAIAEKDRALSAKNKDLKKVEHKLKEERSNNGKRSAELGQLRKDNNALKKAMAKAEPEKKARDTEIARLREENIELQATIDRLNKALSKNEEVTDLYGHNLERLLNEKHQYQVEALKWQARWQIESLLRAKSKRERHLDMNVLVEPKNLQNAYLLALRTTANKLLSNFDAKELEQRKETLKEINNLVGLEELAGQVQLEESTPLAVEIKIAPGKYCEATCIEGKFAYEGPHGWLRTNNGSFLITPQDVIKHNLVTGDKLKLTIECKFVDDDDTGVNLEVLEKAESKESVCTLQRIGDEILVINPYSYALQLSQGEFDYSGYNFDDPVSVIYPDMEVVKLPDDPIIYARIVKAHDWTWQKLPPKERKRSEKKRPGLEVETESFSSLLLGKTVLVVGGESFKYQLKSIVEALSGSFLFQSGFNDKRMVEGKVKKADEVILITSELSHSVQKLVLKAADKHQIPYRYYNERGAVLFREFLSS